MWVLRITCSSVQGTHGRAESCLYQAHPPHYLCLSGNCARHWGMGAGRQQAPAATTIAQHRLDRLSVCSCSYCAPPKCLPPQIPTKEHWVAWDVYRLFLVLQLVSLRDEVR